MKEAMIFDIQRNSYVDGPGIRTTVFLKGCNLKCMWCHNPESQAIEPQLMFYKKKCTGCGRCHGMPAENTEFVCFNDAKVICGKTYTVDEVWNIVISDQAFYKNSGGGVTFSDGECMLQIDFLCEILERCNRNGIHTAVDTAGNVPWKYFEKIMKYTDLFLYDIKLLDKDKHRYYTGADNGLILCNLKNLLEMNAKLWIRIPVIGGVNDSVAEMSSIKDFIQPYHPLKIELLPYHKTGLYKYETLNLKKHEFEVPDEKNMLRLKAIFE